MPRTRRGKLLAFLLLGYLAIEAVRRRRSALAAAISIGAVLSRLWRPMARTDRNRERRAPGTPAPTCSPTICRGVRSDKYRSSLGLLARRWPLRSAGCRPRPKHRARQKGATTSFTALAY
jgi:hypothetical protein